MKKLASILIVMGTAGCQAITGAKDYTCHEVWVYYRVPTTVFYVSNETVYSVPSTVIDSVKKTKCY